MRKKLAALGLASAMVLSMASVAGAADPVYSVGAIEGNAYAYDSDKSAVDLTNPNPDFAYGDTMYYPLLSNQGVSNSAAITAAQEALESAEQAKQEADEAFAAAQQTAGEKAAALTAAQAVAEKAAAVQTAADEWKAAVDAAAEADVITEKQNAYNAAVAAYSAELTPETEADAAVTAAGTLVSTAAAAVTAAEGEKTAADTAVESAQGSVTAAAAAVTEKQEALNTILSANFSYVHEYDAVRGIKIKQSWDQNGKLVNNVEIVKKKAAASAALEHNYIYFVAVELESSSSTSEADINGTIQLRKSGSNGFDYEERQLDVAVSVGFPVATDSVITTDPQVFKEGSGFNGDAEEEFRFEADEDSYFTVNTIGQGKLLIAMDTKFDSDIAALYPEANLDFFNGNGATFNKIGTLTLSADEGSYLYKVNVDGTLSQIQAEYDEYEEAFVFKTRSLDRYLISDVALKSVAVNNGSTGNNGGSSSDSNSGSVDVVNPGTGAAA